MKIEDNQAQRMIVESGEWIGDRVAMQTLEVLVFKDYRNTKQSGGGKDVDERGLQGDVGLRAFREIHFAGQDFVPSGDRFVFGNLDVSDSEKKTLEKLRAGARL